MDNSSVICVIVNICPSKLCVNLEDVKLKLLGCRIGPKEGKEVNIEITVVKTLMAGI